VEDAVTIDQGPPAAGPQPQTAPGPEPMPGPVALVGSGEYTPAMLDVEAELIAGRPPRYVQLPTAAGREGEARLRYWVELGRAQADRLGVTAVPLLVTSREQAADPQVVAQVADAGLIYLSGGDPGFLADTLRDTPLWAAIVAAWRGGAALAGCSAGAMAFASRVPSLRLPGAAPKVGLGLFPHVQVLPHFDRLLGRMPDLLTRPLLHSRDGVHLIGVDEDTALVGGPEQFRVAGRASAWVLGDGPRRGYPAGATLRLPAPASR
jgi:cyanophycinase-like exopeptidase